MIQLTDRKTLTLAAAKEIAAAAAAEAHQHGWNVVIAILDDGGHLLYFERLDGTQLASIEVAVAKARAAVYYKRPTKQLEERVVGGGVNALNLPHFMPIQGGEPIVVQGQLLGAIGVSGVTSEQDAQIARAALQAVK